MSPGWIVLALLVALAVLWLLADYRRRPPKIGLPVFDQTARQLGFSLDAPADAPRRPQPGSKK